MYSSCASSTWSLPSRLRARPAKMSRISWLRSSTLTFSFSVKLRCCAGLKFSSRRTTPASVAATSSFSSATLPAPMYVAGVMRRTVWLTVATGSTPAVRARRSSSRSDSSAPIPGSASRREAYATPTRTARSACGPTLCVPPFIARRCAAGSRNHGGTGGSVPKGRGSPASSRSTSTVSVRTRGQS